MKKFFMTSPFQTSLRKGVYTAVDNQKLCYDKETGFPLLALINAYAEKGEKIGIYVTCSDYVCAEDNLDSFHRELEELCTEKEIPLPEVGIISIPYDDRIDTQLSLFRQLIEVTADGDTLYVCATYGSKAIPIVQFMSLNYAYRIHSNVSIGCVAYGKVDHACGTMEIYDITSLFYMDEMVRVLAERKTENPMEILKQMLDA